MRQILNIEAEYCRVYLNSLALQAVVERCTHNSPLRTQFEQPNNNESPDTDSEVIPAATLVRWMGNDRPYIREVIDACRSVLRIVTDNLAAGDYLKHTPVRTYFRIISVSIILLKVFSPYVRTTEC